jgi:tetratricopeptide (TPR) repeat protein
MIMKPKASPPPPKPADEADDLGPGQDVLARAVEHHRAGRLEAAVAAYEKVLAADPNNPQALHWLGLLRNQQGDAARAVELMGRAVALRPSAPAFHVNLAEAYRNLGELRRALGSCRLALQLAPELPEALCSHGLVLHAMGRHDEAIEQLRRALDARPDYAPVHNNLGMILREIGRPEEAAGHFRRAVELAPDLAPARAYLAQTLLESGRPQEALEHAAEAVRLQPDLANMRHMLGLVLAALDRPLEARAEFLEAARLAPEMPGPHAQVGLSLGREGQFNEAVPWLKQATSLAPEVPAFWAHLAELHMEREDFEEAVPCWERLLALAPEDRVGPIISLGWALQQAGRLAEAGEKYHAAAAINPGAPAVQLHLGGYHEDLGELAEAEACFRAALAVAPNMPIPHSRLATLLRGKLPEADLDALERRLADPDLPPHPRARLLFGLAHVLDARGDYTRAATYLRESNALSLELAKGRRDYNPAEHERFVENALRVFTPEFFARTAGWGSDTRRPVFVFGLPRSGTTLVEQVLSSHPQIYGAGELRFSRISLDALPAAVGLHENPLECLARADSEAVAEVAAAHLDRLRALDGGRAERIVDKLPDNYMFLGLLVTLFPEATFIHCRRDLRDIAVSCWMTDFGSVRWANHPEHLASRFAAYRRLMDHWRSVLPVPIHEVDYEETVSDLESVARRLVSACGLGWDPACLAFHTNRRPVRTASVTQVRQPVYTRSVARWKNYEDELADLFAMLPLDAPAPYPSREPEPEPEPTAV